MTRAVCNPALRTIFFMALRRLTGLGRSKSNWASFALRLPFLRSSVTRSPLRRITRFLRLEANLGLIRSGRQPVSSAAHHLTNRTPLSAKGRSTWTMVEMPEPQSSIDHENQLAMGVCPKTRSRGCIFFESHRQACKDRAGCSGIPVTLGKQGLGCGAMWGTDPLLGKSTGAAGEISQRPGCQHPCID